MPSFYMLVWNALVKLHNARSEQSCWFLNGKPVLTVFPLEARHTQYSMTIHQHHIDLFRLTGKSWTEFHFLELFTALLDTIITSASYWLACPFNNKVNHSIIQWEQGRGGVKNKFVERTKQIENQLKLKKGNY